MGSEFGITPDTKPEVRLDGVGIFWIVFAVTWTVILISGMAFLWTKRDMPILRIRGLGLSFTAIAFLHCYWVAVTTGYVYGPLMPEVAEFWIMSIWFPFGIALFHASNSRFLYVANAQKQYVKKTGDLGWDGQRPRIRKTLVARWKMLPYTQRVLIFVGLGMVAHVSIPIAESNACMHRNQLLTSGSFPSPSSCSLFLVNFTLAGASLELKLLALLWSKRLSRVVVGSGMLHLPLSKGEWHLMRLTGGIMKVAIYLLATILGLGRCSRHSMALSEPA